MYHDLNIPWPGSIAAVTPSLEMAQKLGYGVVALTITTSNFKIQPTLTPAILEQLREKFQLKILSRLTVILDDTTKNLSFLSLAAQFDLVAVRPLTEKALQSASTALDVDLISLDMTSRSSFYLRHKIACAAVARGIRFELCYGPATQSAEARRYTISNAAAVIRATRERGIVLSSGAGASGLRAPLDAVNLVNVWGLNSQAARNAVDREPLAAVVNGELRNTSAKQTVRPLKRQKLEGSI